MSQIDKLVQKGEAHIAQVLVALFSHNFSFDFEEKNRLTVNLVEA